MRVPSVTSFAARLLNAASARFHRKVETADLVAGIEECKSGLLGFGRASDVEFTELAKGLGSLNRRLTELRQQASELNAVLQDRDDERAISGAYALYKDSVDLVHASAGIAVSAQEQLTCVEAALLASCADREAFERHHMFLRIVTLSIRIEAARLPSEGQAVFLNVASAIEETGEQIRACTVAAFTNIEAVISESRSARQELKSTEEALHITARKSIQTIQDELAGLQAALRPCLAESNAISELFGAAQPRILRVISALQHQDIVRQQLEHVVEGFSDLHEHLKSARSAPSRRVEWNYVLHASRIQAAQLEASHREIETAGEAVVTGLQALLETSESMIARFTAMENSAATAVTGCRIEEMFTRELRSLTQIIERSQEANARTARLVQRIDEVVRLFSHEIGRYELDVKIVALNAQIAAARLSDADALNRLAEETSRFSDANATLTRKLAADLNQSLAQLDQVKSEGAGFLSIVTRERGNLQQGLVIVKEKLRRLIERVHTAPIQARTDYAPVHQQCAALLHCLRFPALLNSAFEPADAVCRELVARSTAAAGTAQPSEASLEKIRQHERRYTMQKEQHRHAAVLQGRSADSSSATSEGAVELFEEAPSSDRPTFPRPAAKEPPALSSPVPATAMQAKSGDLGDGIELF